MDTKELVTQADAHYNYLPPELLLDENHPANDEYAHNIRKIKDHITSLALKMRPVHVKVIKLRVQGKTNAAIAEKLEITPETVSRIYSTPKAKSLYALLTHLELAMEGPSVLIRRNMLYRIMKRNEIDKPNVSVAAIAELNNMDDRAKAHLAANSLNGTINININTQLLPKTNLDT